MAIVQMQRINICALKKNRKAILERLQELGAMEIDIQLEDDNLGEKQDVASSRALFERRAQTADQALVILNTYVPEKKGMLDSLAGKPLVEKELFEKAAENQDQYMATASRIVTQNGQQVPLTIKEFDLLLLFVRNRNIALYRDTIYESVWEGEYAEQSRTVDLHVQRLKKKLHWEEHIVAVYKVGYRLEG